FSCRPASERAGANRVTCCLLVLPCAIKTCAVPEGTPVQYFIRPSTPPSAPCWAKLFRAYGARFSALLLHCQNLTLSCHSHRTTRLEPILDLPFSSSALLI